MAFSYFPASGPVRDRLCDLRWRGGAETRGGRADPRALDGGGHAVLVQHRHQGFAHGQLGDGLRDVEAGVGAEGLGGRAHGLLVARREGPERVLDAVAELPEDRLGDVERALGDEIHPDSLRADEAHHLLDLVEQGLRGIAEEEMGLIEKEHELGAIEVAGLRQLLEDLREQRQQEGRVEARPLDQILGGEQVDRALPVCLP